MKHPKAIPIIKLDFNYLFKSNHEDVINKCGYEKHVKQKDIFFPF